MHHYSLIESETKTGLWTIALCRKSIQPVFKMPIKNIVCKSIFLNSDNWSISGYAKLIIDAL